MGKDRPKLVVASLVAEMGEEEEGLTSASEPAGARISYGGVMSRIAGGKVAKGIQAGAEQHEVGGDIGRIDGGAWQRLIAFLGGAGEFAGTHESRLVNDQKEGAIRIFAQEPGAACSELTCRHWAGRARP